MNHHRVLLGFSWCATHHVLPSFATKNTDVHFNGGWNLLSTYCIPGPVLSILYFNPVSGILTFIYSNIVKNNYRTTCLFCYIIQPTHFTLSWTTNWPYKGKMWYLSESRKPCLCHDSILVLNLFSKTLEELSLLTCI